MITLVELADFIGKSVENIDQTIEKKIFTLSQKQQSFNRILHEESRMILSKLGLNFKSKIFTIAALKGGIGKTFLSTHVAVRGSMLGAKILLIDVDPEACATNTLLTEEQAQSSKRITLYDIFKFNLNFQDSIIKTKYPGLDLIPSSLRVSKIERLTHGKNPKTLLRKYVENLDYDYILFELPPSFSTISGSAYLASDLIVIPCTPSIYSLESVDLTIEAVGELSQEFDCPTIEHRILFNMYNPKRSASQDTLNILIDDHKDHLYPFKIRESAEIQNAINAGTTIYEIRCSKFVREGLDQFVKILYPIQKQGISGILKENLQQDSTYHLH